MNLWIASRRPGILIGTLAVSIVALAVLGAREVPMPSLLQGALFSVPLNVFVPLLGAGGVMQCLGNSPSELEKAQVRQANRYDAVALVLVMALVMVACYIGGLVAGGSAPTAGGRNLVGYTGLAVLFMTVFDARVAGLVPAGYAVLTSTFGWTAARDPRWWAWPLHASAESLAMIIASLILVVAAASLGIRGRPLV